MKETEVKKVVRERYGKVARQDSSCCCSSTAGCCGSAMPARKISKQIGYSDTEMDSVPEGANLGLGCGNPIALASLKKGETVLDLGSGAGFDCFLAANKVGARGRVIGVDMTAEMLEKARENAAKGGYKNVEFRLGEIENLPVADSSVDAIISNCVINLSPDKPRVFKEAFRVLKPGGRLMVSDIVLLKELPDFVRESAAAYVACVAGASMKEDYLAAIKAAGFSKVEVLDEAFYAIDSITEDPTAKAIIKEMKLSPEALKSMGDSVASVKVQGIKPAA